MKPSDSVPLRVLYLFAGKERRADIGDCLKELAGDYLQNYGIALKVELTEVDTLRGGAAHNLLDSSICDHYLALVEKGHYHIVILAPPCNTFPRAVFANRAGPAPIRDRTHPRGFP